MLYAHSVPWGVSMRYHTRKPKKGSQGALRSNIRPRTALPLLFTNAVNLGVLPYLTAYPHAAHEKRTCFSYRATGASTHAPITVARCPHLGHITSIFSVKSLLRTVYAFTVIANKDTLNPHACKYLVQGILGYGINLYLRAVRNSYRE